MLTTIEMLDQAKAALGVTSNYALAKKLGFSRQRISLYYNNRRILDDKGAFQIAELLGLDPAYVVACVNMERAEKAEDKSSISFWMDAVLKYPKSDNLSHYKNTVAA